MTYPDRLPETTTRWHGIRRLMAMLTFTTLAACGHDTATGPLSEKLTTTPTPTPAPTPTPSPAPNPPHPPFPSRPDAGIVYDRVTASSVGNQRYVVYQDSTFALQYMTQQFGFFEYKGKYSRADSVLTFLFDANRGQWIAEGIIQGDLLTVKFNNDMIGSDFEDGAYRAQAIVLKGNIYLANGDGSNLVRLAEGEWPAWSPDELQLAFHRDGYVHIIDADGSDEIRLARGGSPTWSPDGRQLAFANSNGIAVMNTDGSGITTLISHTFRKDTYAPWDMGVGKPAWSPDGKLIAFQHMGDGDMQPAQIHVMNADGTNERRPTYADRGINYAQSDPSWAPVGYKIAFWSYGYGITTVNPNGGEQSSIYMSFPAVAYGARPTFSFDGTQVAFTAGRFPSNKPEIWTKRLNGGDPKLLIRGAYDAAWSPRSHRIAFVSTGLQ